MAAACLCGVLVAAPETGRFKLEVKTDAPGVRTSTAKAPGLGAAEAEVTRLRLGLDGSRPFRIEGGAVLTPSVESGVRHDAVWIRSCRAARLRSLPPTTMAAGATSWPSAASS